MIAACLDLLSDVYKKRDDAFVIGYILIIKMLN